jgi:hypothetical protein
VRRPRGRLATLALAAGLLGSACWQQAPGKAASPPPRPQWEYTSVVAYPVIRATRSPVTLLNSITAPKEPEGSALDGVGADVPTASMERPVILKARYRDDVQIPRWAQGPDLVEYANQLGAEGWELVSAESFLHFANMDGRRFEGMTLVFKRRK